MIKVFLTVLNYTDLCKHAKSNPHLEKIQALFFFNGLYILKVPTTLSGNNFEYTYFFYVLKFPGKLNATCILMKHHKC